MKFNNITTHKSPYKKVYITYLKDLEASNVKDANEGSPLSLGLVQGFVDPHDQPAEHPLIGGFGQGLHCKLCLLLGLGFLHIVPAHLQDVK